ncbi:hypothetical protein BT63DRAFT_415187 [Microthyrium microscopicum]|uniref:Nop52-domain-containing protein n=1 Tax=Microthyrium microscopicum TaxID=703497 RepID=A0A6A6U5T8_9PEZI|nr:hypothetical protein BT63DRAFT_415187 [Microthyrium microscopicum]
MDANSPFIKQLASSDRKVRDKALESLRSYLRQKSDLNQLELLKLWKGLFYCMWMSDRAHTQQQLARDLGSLVVDIPPSAVMPFLEAFWTTMAREWMGIDVLRMDKFLYLVRIYHRTALQYLSKQHWKNKAQIDEYLRILSDTPLNPTDNKIPNGMRYHMIDLYVDELEEAGADKEDSDVPVETLLQPLRDLGAKTPTKPVRKRVKEALEDERVKRWLGEEVEVENDEEEKDAEEQGDDDEEWGGIEE